MNWTPQQEDFFTSLLKSSDNLAMMAVAGSGKTSTAVEGIKRLPTSISVVTCAFNTLNKKDLEKRVPPHAQARTFNSLGLESWKRQLGKSPRVSDQRAKLKAIRDSLGIKFGQIPDLSQALGLCKAHGIVPSGAPGEARSLLPDEPEVYGDLLSDLDLGGGLATWLNPVRDALLTSIRMGWAGAIDFDDMLYLPVVYRSPMLHPDLTVADEAQDISPVQRTMLWLMAQSNRLAALGDPWQGIYAFRGADAESFPELIRLFNMTEMPLTVSFRCPKAVVREAQKYVPEIESHPSAPEGQVERLGKYDETVFSAGDAILCRNNKPVISLAYRLIRRGVSCQVRGRDIGKGLQRLVKASNAVRIPELDAWLQGYERDEMNKAMARGKESLAEVVSDKTGSLRAIMDYVVFRNQRASVQDVLDEIDNLFADKARAVTLSTIHKAKGLEWPRVFFLDSQLIPSKFAKTESQRQQERNLAYVAITRAQRSLFYITSEEFGE